MVYIKGCGFDCRVIITIITLNELIK